MGKVKAFLNKFFRIEERGSTITRELIGGLIVFLAMFYILPVNSFMVGIALLPGECPGVSTISRECPLQAKSSRSSKVTSAASHTNLG